MSGSFSRPPAWAKLGPVSGRREQASERSDSVALAAAPYLTRGVELDALLVAIVDTIVERLGAERGTLYLVDGRTRTLSSVVAHLPELERIRLDFGQGVAGSVAAEGRVINVPDTAADPRHDATFDQRTGFTTRSLLAVPIHDSGKEVIGVLQLLNAARGRFEAEDEDSARALARRPHRRARTMV